MHWPTTESGASTNEQSIQAPTVDLQLGFNFVDRELNERLYKYAYSYTYVASAMLRYVYSAILLAVAKPVCVPSTVQARNRVPVLSTL